MLWNAKVWIPHRGFLLLFCTALLFGCRKPDEDLGLDLLPGEELGLSFDTVPIRAFSFPDSAIRTSGLSRNLVGSYSDPDFGTLRASTVVQLRLTTNNIGQGLEVIGLVPDSIVLALAYETPSYGYGNLHPQVFTVHELTEDLSVDSLYHSDDFPQVASEDLVAEHASLLTPEPFTSPEIGGVTALPQLRIRLKESLARRFLSAFNTPDLVDNTAFLTFFKGLQVGVENGTQAPYQGGVLHFNTQSSASKVTVYYKDTLSSDPQLPRVLDLAISSNSVRYTTVERDRTQAVMLVQALSDTSALAPSTYVQALGGLRTAIRFPELEVRTAEGKALSKAELVVPVSGVFYPSYGPPAQLFVFRKGSAGGDVFLPDQLQGIQAIGGNYDAATNAYVFNITRYVQGVFSGTFTNGGLELASGSAGVSVNRVVLCGPQHPTTPMQLQLTFTTY